jgi:hypothetical protein
VDHEATTTRDLIRACASLHIAQAQNYANLLAAALECGMQFSADMRRIIVVLLVLVPLTAMASHSPDPPVHGRTASATKLVP